MTSFDIVIKFIGMSGMNVYSSSSNPISKYVEQNKQLMRQDAQNYLNKLKETKSTPPTIEQSKPIEVKKGTIIDTYA